MSQLRFASLLVAFVGLGVAVYGCGGGEIGGPEGGPARTGFGDGPDPSAPAPAPTEPAPVPPPPPSGGGGNPSGRGPTGQWPPNLPAYSTPADVVTNGSMGSLTSALGSGSCSSGCVIEHPGDITGEVTLTAQGSGGTLIRPPIGQRSDYDLTGGSANVVLRGNNFYVAGYRKNVRLQVTNGANVGFAWIESIPGSAGGSFLVLEQAGDNVEAWFYEVVIRQYLGSSAGDRIVVGGSGTPHISIVGSWIAGSQAPPPQHADTVQLLSGTMDVFDSVIWPSYDKGFQTESTSFLINVDNTWMAKTAHADAVWNGDGNPVLTGGGPYITFASVNFTNSTLLGPYNTTSKGGRTVTIANSELYDAGSAYQDRGGNTSLSALVAPPPPPTHTELDAIWSP